MLKNRIVVIVGVVGALALLLGGIGVAYAYAQAPEPPVEGRSFYFRGRIAGRGMFGGGPMRGGYSLVKATAEVIGLTEDEVIAALQEGQTFADIAGSDDAAQQIVDIVMAEHEAQLQEAVDAGRLTEAQMEERLEDIEEHVIEQLGEIHAPRLLGGNLFGGGVLGRFGGGSWSTMFDAVADALGLDPTALFTRLHDGESVADIAEGKGVHLDELHDAIEDARVEARKQAIEEAVEAGRLTEEQAEWMLEGLEEGYVPGGRGFTSGRNCGPAGGMLGRGRGMGW